MGGLPYFPILIFKISEGFKIICEDAGKITAENLENEHSIKPKKEIIPKALGSCGVFFLKVKDERKTCTSSTPRNRWSFYRMNQVCLPQAGFFMAAH